MSGFDSIGRLLVMAGILLVIIGIGLVLAPRLPPLGRLPGDIVVQRDGFSCVVPIVTSIVLSVLLTIILNIVLRFLGR